MLEKPELSPLSTDLVAAGACIPVAAHAVAARDFSFPVDWISIDTNFIAKEPQAVEKERDGIPTAMVPEPDFISPIRKRGFTVSAEEREVVRRYCVGLATPWAANNKIRQIIPSYAPKGGIKELVELSFIILTIGKDKLRARSNHMRILKDAEAFVDTNWPRIGYLATKLFDRRTLYSEEIDSLIREVPEGFSLPMLPIARRQVLEG